MTFGMFLCQLEPRFLIRTRDIEDLCPERHLPPMIIGAFVIPISLFLYGWTIHFGVHWRAPVVGLVLMGLGVVLVFIPAFSYFVDAFGIHAASAVAASITLRCMTGAILPLAGPAMYRRLGQGWGNSLLGFVALGFTSVPVLLMRFGKSMRLNSRLDIRT